VITTNPTIHPLIDTNDDEDAEEEASHLNDGVGVFVQDFAVITQLTQDTNVDDNETGGSDSDLPQSDLPLQSTYAQTKMKKKKKPTSTGKYNSIRAEGKLLANIASADSLEQFNKLLTLLRYVHANVQNKTGKELKEAASTYLDITEFDHNIDILPSSRMRTEDRMSTKRKVSSVESATIGAVKKCGFCKSIGHNKQSCMPLVTIISSNSHTLDSGNRAKS